MAFDEGNCQGSDCDLETVDDPPGKLYDDILVRYAEPGGTFAADLFYYDVPGHTDWRTQTIEIPVYPNPVEPEPCTPGGPVTPGSPPPASGCRIGLYSYLAYKVRWRMGRRHVLDTSRVDPADRRWEACGGCGENTYVARFYSMPHLHWGNPERLADPTAGGPGFSPQKYTAADWCGDD